ncbi:MAG: DUF5989 family protein [Nitrospinota bacterium]|nr:DUF5989 family protein [Nitrospinota bacterium]MDH5679061.1 DUF5989 family protein [Nitrospinota bacterium]
MDEENQEQQSDLQEFWEYLTNSKKLLLLPVIISLLALGALIVLTESSVVAPFIYTLF